MKGEGEQGDAVIYYIDRKLGGLGGSEAPVTISRVVTWRVCRTSGLPPLHRTIYLITRKLKERLPASCSTQGYYN